MRTDHPYSRCSGTAMACIVDMYLHVQVLHWRSLLLQIHLMKFQNLLWWIQNHYNLNECSVWCNKFCLHEGRSLLKLFQRGADSLIILEGVLCDAAEPYCWTSSHWYKWGGENYTNICQFNAIQYTCIYMYNSTEMSWFLTPVCHNCWSDQILKPLKFDTVIACGTKH